MATIDTEIAKAAATLDQGLQETTKDPEEPRNEETNDGEVSCPSTTTDTTRQVYNLRKCNNWNISRDYLHCVRDHLMSLVYIALTQLLMKSGLQKYKRVGCAEVTKEFLQLHTREAFGPLIGEDVTENKKGRAQNADVPKGKVQQKNQGGGCADG